jgi:hypothetical protein
MKRNPKISKVNKIWTLFTWNICKKCNQEFRRENGWSMPINRTFGTINACVCKECCEKPEDAYDILLEWNNANPSPKLSTTPNEMEEYREPSLKRVILKYCPECNEELGEGVTRCWKQHCDYVVPEGFVAISNG